MKKVDDYFARLQEEDRTPTNQEMMSKIKTDLVSGISGMESEHILNLLIASRTKGFVENREISLIEDETVTNQKVIFIFLFRCTEC